MIVTLVAPFRVPLNLNKNLILSDLGKWCDHLGSLQARLGAEDVGWQVGNYFADASTLVYKGIRDVGCGLDRLYTLKLSKLRAPVSETVPGMRGLVERTEESFERLRAAAQGIYPNVNFSALERRTAECFDFAGADWELRIIDNNIAVLCADVTADAERLLALPAEQLSMVDELTASFAILLVGALWGGEVRRAAEWLNAQMADGGTGRFARRGRAPRGFLAPGESVFDLPNSASADYWRNAGSASIAWVAHVYTLDADGAADARLLREESHVLLTMGAEAGAVEMIAAGRDAYGWGINLRRAQAADRRGWLDAMCIAQFYYYSLDIIDRRVPILLAALHRRHRGGRSERALAVGREIVQEAQMACYEFVDVKLRVAGDALPIIDRLFEEWDLGLLLSNVRHKLDNLRDAITYISDEMDKKSDSKVEFLIYIITLFSLVSFPFIVHDYLTPAEPAPISRALNWYQRLQKDFVLVGSASIIAMGVTAFAILRRRSHR